MASEPFTMRLRTSLIAAALTLSAMAQQPPSPTTLAALRDHYRPLLVFASSPDDPALLAQFHRLKDAAAPLHDRDVLLIAVPFNNPSPSPLALSADDAIAARRRFHVAPDKFTAILIGKDGGEKLRSEKPISLKKLQETIDSMPMRQQEMHDPAQER